MDWTPNAKHFEVNLTFYSIVSTLEKGGGTLVLVYVCKNQFYIENYSLQSNDSGNALDLVEDYHQ